MLFFPKCVLSFFAFGWKVYKPVNESKLTMVLLVTKWKRTYKEENNIMAVSLRLYYCHSKLFHLMAVFFLLEANQFKFVLGKYKGE